MRWKPTCIKPPPYMETVALCSSVLYIYLSLSGLVPFLPIFCKYLYLNQNILAKYKTNKQKQLWVTQSVLGAAPRKGSGVWTQ